MVFATSFEPRGNQALSDHRPPNILISYAYAAQFARVEYTPPFLMIDSGAFSAWQAGRPTDLHGYGRFAQSLVSARRGLETWCVNLDVIPGEFGRTSSADERAAGIAESLHHADILRRVYRLPLVEVFHQDEPWDFLDTLLKRLPAGGILGISPRNDVSPKSRAAWLWELAQRIAARRGIEAFPRCHGLAVTCRECVEAFPFYSVDSSTWAVSYRFGNVITAQGRQQCITKDGQFPRRKHRRLNSSRRTATCATSPPLLAGRRPCGNVAAFDSKELPHAYDLHRIV